MKTTADELRAKISKIEGRQIELTAERDEHAFAAHVERNAKAQKRLDDIGAELARLENEKASLTAAIAEAGRRAQAATAAERAEGERKRAEQAAPIAARLEARGKAMDEALASYVANFRAIQADLDELQSLGCPVPSRSLVEVNSHRAHDSALAALGDKFVRPIPPLQRHSFSKLLTGYVLPARTWITSKTNKAADAA
jgi:chromosome segregation ATPase